MEPAYQEEELDGQGRALITRERKTENMRTNADRFGDVAGRRELHLISQSSLRCGPQMRVGAERFARGESEAPAAARPDTDAALLRIMTYI